MFGKREAAGLALVPALEATAVAEGVGAVTFERAYALHAGYVAGLAGRILGRNDEVPDVVQDVFLIAHRRLKDVRQAGALRTRLGRITVREASRRLRWRRLREFWRPAYGDVELVADPAAAELRPLVALLYAASEWWLVRSRRTP